MAETIEKKLYNGEVSIIFYPNSHRYRLKKEKTYLPSVTSITGIIDKSRALIPWAVNLDFNYLIDKIESYKEVDKHVLLEFIEESKNQHNIKKEEAADFGSQIHKFAEEFGKYKLGLNECPEINKDWAEEVKNGVSSFIDWVSNNNIEFIDCEKFVYSKEYGYIGLTDALVKIDGKLYLIDYKSSSGIYNEMLYQVSAYANAYEEENGKILVGSKIVKFDKKDGSLLVKDISIEEHNKNFEAFKGCLKIKEREKELTKKYEL